MVLMSETKQLDNYKCLDEYSILNSNLRRFKRVFINVALTLIGYRKTTKLDYYFLTNASLVPVWIIGFNITGLRNEPEAASKIASTLLEHVHIIN